jgi:DNA-directed RNA polymerase specialized sigma24 family protein
MSTDRQRRDAALERLPPTYAKALRLRDAGIGSDLIAACVGVERESVPTLIRIAEAKLAAAGYSGW